MIDYDLIERIYADYIGHPDFNADKPEHGAKYAHCDQYVLHAPHSCVYCDGFPIRQALRRDLRISFTDDDPEVSASLHLRPCPAEVGRPNENINRWHGNVAQTSEMILEQRAEWAKFWEEHQHLGGLIV